MRCSLAEKGKTMATCKDCLHDEACRSMLRSMGYTVDGDGVDADKRCGDFKWRRSSGEKLYAARDKNTGKLVSDLTNPRRKYWDRRGNAENAIRAYNGRSYKKHGEVELVVYELVEVKDGKAHAV